MKQRLVSVLLILVMAVVISGCGENADAPVSNFITGNVEEELKIDPVKEEIDTFMNTYINTNERPIGVMIDNDDENARPQAGLDEAYLVYEMVVEGGATRFLAFFKGTDTEKIGPVRSSRHYFLDYLMENGGIYTHYGWSPKAQQDISSLRIEKINGVLGEDAGVFWRERKFKGDWHSAYTSIKNIKESAEKKGYSLVTDHKNGIKYADTYITLSKDKPAGEINLKYPSYLTGYKYNEQTGLYEKSIWNKPHTMQNGNVPVFKNIIIELKYDTALGDGTARRNINTTGNGKGYYITNGAYTEITWHKDSRKGNTVYKNTDGTELIINPGKTIVNVISPSQNIEIK